LYLLYKLNDDFAMIMNRRRPTAYFMLVVIEIMIFKVHFFRLIILHSGTCCQVKNMYSLRRNDLSSWFRLMNIDLHLEKKNKKINF
jgi:hypothetical protein